jgi:hypothetical protein
MSQKWIRTFIDVTRAQLDAGMLKLSACDHPIECIETKVKLGFLLLTHKERKGKDYSFLLTSRVYSNFPYWRDLDWWTQDDPTISMYKTFPLPWIAFVRKHLLLEREKTAPEYKDRHGMCIDTDLSWFFHGTTPEAGYAILERGQMNPVFGVREVFGKGCYVSRDVDTAREYAMTGETAETKDVTRKKQKALVLFLGYLGKLPLSRDRKDHHVVDRDSDEDEKDEEDEKKSASRMDCLVTHGRSRGTVRSTGHTTGHTTSHSTANHTKSAAEEFICVRNQDVMYPMAMVLFD